MLSQTKIYFLLFLTLSSFIVWVYIMEVNLVSNQKHTKIKFGFMFFLPFFYLNNFIQEKSKTVYCYYTFSDLRIYNEEITVL